MRLGFGRIAVAAALAAAVSPLAEDGVKTEEKTRVQLGGPLGGILSVFGGKDAKEGIVTTTAVLGERRLIRGGDSGQLVDLAEQAVYELDFKKKTYTVATFAELKQRFEEERAKAEQEAKKARDQAQKQSGQSGQAGQAGQDTEAKELQVDFEVSRTAEKREIAGHEAKLVILRATVHEKGRAVQQAGGLLFRNDLWLTPKLAELDELQAWNARYAQKMAEVYGVAPGGATSAQQMATLFARYPGAMQAMQKLRAETEKVDLEGTSVSTTLTLTAIKSAEQVAKAEKEGQKADTGIGGLLAKQMFKKAAGDPADPRSMLLTSAHELLKVTTDATAGDVALPAGFKPK
jgi:hypothetical protein